jgi:hypothetical protein
MIPKITPTQDTRAGRMMSAGRVKVTIKSKLSGQHLTLTFRGWRKVGNSWEKADFAQATNIAVKDAQKQKLGTYYPARGTFYLATENSVLLFALAQAVAFINGAPTHAQAEISEANECGRCGKELTDPISIEIGLGPDCNAKVTGSKYATQPVQQKLEVA